MRGKIIFLALGIDGYMPLAGFGGEQAVSVPACVEQLGNCGPEPSTLKIPSYHVPGCATHMVLANSPADVVPSPVLVMDFWNL